jgi:peptidoglycan/LPS O-acetylase OafA/YrhL
VAAPVERMPALDGLRVVAMLLISVHHAWFFQGLPALDHGVLRDVVASAWLATESFFVVSGFVLYLPIVRAGGDMGKVSHFYARRLVRVYPLYLVVLVLLTVFGTSLTFAHVDRPPTAAGWELFGTNATLSYLPVHGLVYGGMGVNAAVWTLSVEVVFYLLLPAVTRLFLRRPWTCLLVSVVVSRLYVSFATRVDHFFPPSAAWKVPIERWHAVAQFPTYLANFAAGMALAVLVVRRRDHPLMRWARQHPAWTTVLGGIVMVVPALKAIHIKADGHDPGYIIFASGGGSIFGLTIVVLGLAYAGRGTRAVMGNRVMAYLGTELSYAYYLVHIPLMELLIVRFHVPQDRTLGSMLLLLSVIPVALLLAYPLHRWVELPPRKALSRRLAGGARRRWLPPVRLPVPATGLAHHRPAHAPSFVPSFAPGPLRAPAPVLATSFSSGWHNRWWD